MDVTLVMIGAAWLAIALVLAWGAIASVYRLLSAPARLPIFEMLERRGLNAVQLAAAAGAGGVARALRRCATCPGRRHCGRRPVACPNEALIRYLSRLAQA